MTDGTERDVDLRFADVLLLLENLQEKCKCGNSDKFEVIAAEILSIKTQLASAELKRSGQTEFDGSLNRSGEKQRRENYTSEELTALARSADPRVNRAIRTLQFHFRWKTLISFVGKVAFLNKTRERVVQEFLSTEETYVAKLEESITNFLVPIRAANLLSSSELNLIFSNVETICNFHKMLLDEIIERVYGPQHRKLVTLSPRLSTFQPPWHPSQPIGDLFAKLAPYLSVYTEYVNNYDEATALITEKMADSKKFASFLGGKSENGQPGNRILHALLILPIQRIPRYELLLRELVKHTTPLHPDLEDLQIAMEMVREVALEVNKLKKDRDSMREGARLTSLISSNVDMAVINDILNSKETNLRHDFGKATFKNPTWCGSCSKFVWGVYKQGFQCRVCGFVAHKKCLDKAVAQKNCPGTALKTEDLLRNDLRIFIGKAPIEHQRTFSDENTSGLKNSRPLSRLVISNALKDAVGTQPRLPASDDVSAGWCESTMLIFNDICFVVEEKEASDKVSLRSVIAWVSVDRVYPTEWDPAHFEVVMKSGDVHHIRVIKQKRDEVLAMVLETWETFRNEKGGDSAVEGSGEHVMIKSVSRGWAETDCSEDKDEGAKTVDAEPDAEAEAKTPKKRRKKKKTSGSGVERKSRSKNKSTSRRDSQSSKSSTDE